MRRIFCAMILMFVVQLAVNAFAASVVVDRVGTSNVYVVKGYDFVDVGGVEIEIFYDNTTLSNPRLTQGSMLASTMFVPNAKFSATSVKIAAMSLSAINKSAGDLATITFDLKSSNPGPVAIGRLKFVGVTANTITTVDETTGAGLAKEKADAAARAAEEAKAKADADAKAATDEAARIAALDRAKAAEAARVQAAADVIAAENRVREANDRAKAYAAATSGATVGTITLPQDQIASAEAERKTDYQPLVTDLRKDMTLPLGESGGKQESSGERTAGSNKEPEKKSVSYKSTVQLFKDFKGERSPKSLIQLFAEIAPPDFKQYPQIAFSDGKTPLKITLDLKQARSESPKFLLQGANVKKLSGQGEETITWTIEAVPKKDVVEATLTVIDGQTVMEFPLTVVPEVNPLLTKAKVLSEADFAVYLATPPTFDLNKDGKFDAVDDFIYAANYIVAMKITPEKARKEEKSVVPPQQKATDAPKSKEPIKVKDDKAKATEKPVVKPPVATPLKP